MKNLITAVAGLMLLLAVLIQFTHSQLMQSRLFEADRRVDTFRETVRQAGCMDNAAEEKLQEDLAEIFHCDREKVLIYCRREPAFRGEIIEYRVSVPAGGVIADSSFWNIGEEKNRFTYEKQGACASEYTGRENGV